MEQDLNQRITDIEAKLDAFIEQYYRNNNPTSQVFTKDSYFTGKLSFFGKPATGQQSAIATVGNPSGIYVNAEAQAAVTAINAIRDAIKTIGIIV